MGINLLRNWYFAVPDTIINQRSKLEYSGAENQSYTIDGWILITTGIGNISITNSGIKLTNKSFQTTFVQKLDEDLTSSFLGSTVTLSYFVDWNFLLVLTATIPTELSDGIIVSKSFQVTNVIANLRLRAVDNGKKLLVSIDTSNAGSMLLHAAKLESGPVSTLCRKDAAGNLVLNDTPPDYGLELLKCQRYLYVIGSNNFTDIGWYQCREAGTISLHINLPVQMRNTPAISGFYGNAVKNGPDGIGYMPINPAVITGKFLYGSSLILGIKCPEAMPGDYGWVQLDPEVFVTIDSNI